MAPGILPRPALWDRLLTFSRGCTQKAHFNVKRNNVYFWPSHRLISDDSDASTHILFSIKMSTETEHITPWSESSNGSIKLSTTYSYQLQWRRTVQLIAKETQKLKTRSIFVVILLSVPGIERKQHWEIQPNLCIYTEERLCHSSTLHIEHWIIGSRLDNIPLGGFVVRVLTFEYPI